MATPKGHHFQLTVQLRFVHILTYLPLKETTGLEFINCMSCSFTPGLASPNSLLGKSTIPKFPVRTQARSCWFSFYFIISCLLLTLFQVTKLILALHLPSVIFPCD